MLLSHRQLKQLYAAVIMALGGNQDEAAVFAELVSIGDLRGMDWQGIKSLRKHFVVPIQQGIIKLGQQIEVHREDASSVTLEANGELGQVACADGMDRAIEKAKDTGVGLAIIRRAGDSGALVSFTLRALEHDCIGIMFNNTNPYVAPWGGLERLLGIPPVSVAVPAAEEFPVVLDTALTEVQKFFDRPELWASPSDKPRLLTFATRREYALTVVIELLCGGLGLMPLGRDKTRRGEIAVFALAIHIPHFAESADFRAGVDRYVRQIKSVERAAGVSEILLPGERGFREAERRRREGIPVEESVWADTCELCKEIGLNPDLVEAAPESRAAS